MRLETEFFLQNFGFCAPVGQRGNLGYISMICANAGSNEGETEKTLARLDFEGYRRGDRVRVGGVESVP